MARMPDFEADIHRDLSHVAETMRHLMHPHLHHDGTPQPAGTPAPASADATEAPVPENEITAPREEPSMQISSIAGDIKAAVENADQWVREVTETHLPNILAQAAKYEASPIVQALESALLPPEVEAGIAAMISQFAVKYPAAQAAAVQPEQPAAPAQ